MYVSVTLTLELLPIGRGTQYWQYWHTQEYFLLHWPHGSDIIGRTQKVQSKLVSKVRIPGSQSNEPKASGELSSHPRVFLGTFHLAGLS